MCCVMDLSLQFNILLGWPWLQLMKVVPSTYHQCLKFTHQGIELTIHFDPEPFTYFNAIESYNNHCPRIEISTAIPSSSNNFHDPHTILTSTFSTIQINHQGCGEYNLTNAFAVGPLHLDPHTQGHPSNQEKRKNNTPQLKHMGKWFFFSSSIQNGKEIALDISDNSFMTIWNSLFIIVYTIVFTSISCFSSISFYFTICCICLNMN